MTMPPLPFVDVLMLRIVWWKLAGVCVSPSSAYLSYAAPSLPWLPQESPVGVRCAPSRL
jgi:hypothetical protein